MELTQRAAKGLQAMGVKKGDHALSWQPNNQEAVLTAFRGLSAKQSLHRKSGSSGQIASYLLTIYSFDQDDPTPDISEELLSICYRNWSKVR